MRPLSVIVFRFPDGVEYRTTDEVPKVGDTFANGREWTVTAVEVGSGRATVHLRPRYVIQPEPMAFAEA